MSMGMEELGVARTKGLRWCIHFKAGTMSRGVPGICGFRDSREKKGVQIYPL